MGGCADGLLIGRGCECLLALTVSSVTMLNESSRLRRVCVMMLLFCFVFVFHVVFIFHAALVALFLVPIETL